MPPASQLDLVVDRINSEEGRDVEANVCDYRNPGRNDQAMADKVAAALEGGDVEVLNGDAAKQQQKLYAFDGKAVYVADCASLFLSQVKLD